MNIKKVFVAIILGFIALFFGVASAKNDPQGLQLIITVTDKQTGNDVALMGWVDLALLDSKKKEWLCEGKKDSADRHKYVAEVRRYLFDSDGFELHIGRWVDGKYGYIESVKVYFLKMSRATPFSAKVIAELTFDQGMKPFKFSAIYPTAADDFTGYGTKVPGLSFKKLDCTLSAY